MVDSSSDRRHGDTDDGDDGNDDDTDEDTDDDHDDDTADDHDHKNDSYTAAGAAPGASIVDIKYNMKSISNIKLHFSQRNNLIFSKD